MSLFNFSKPVTPAEPIETLEARRERERKERIKRRIDNPHYSFILTITLIDGHTKVNFNLYHQKSIIDSKEKFLKQREYSDNFISLCGKTIPFRNVLYVESEHMHPKMNCGHYSPPNRGSWRSYEQCEICEYKEYTNTK